MKFEIQRQLIENKSNELEASAKTVLAEALPEAGDIEGQGQYWKTHYNTPLGKGTVTKYVYKVGKILKEASG